MCSSVIKPVDWSAIESSTHCQDVEPTVTIPIAKSRYPFAHIKLYCFVAHVGWQY